jgi:hypothetical protein
MKPSIRSQKRADTVDQNTDSEVSHDGQAISIPGLLALLRESIKNVPANKFAFGVVGITAAVCISFLLVRGNWKLAIIGGVAMLVGMVLLQVFAEEEMNGSRQKRILTSVSLMAFAVVLAFLLFKFYAILFLQGGSFNRATAPTPDITATSQRVGLAGRVVTVGFQRTVPGAVVSIDGQPEHTTTDSDGKFVITAQPVTSSGVDLRIVATGYKPYVEHVYPPLRNLEIVLEVP